MDSSRTVSAIATPVAERVIDLALRVRAAQVAARDFLTRYAIEAASSRPTPTQRIAIESRPGLRFGSTHRGQ